jgi:transcriptional regulator GlxA family with amidase domain
MNARGTRPRPRPVYLVLRKDFLLLDLSAVVEPLRLANEIAGAELFSFHYVASSGHVESSVALSVGPVEPLPHALPGDAIVVLIGTRSATMEQNRPLQPPVIQWLRRALAPSHLVMCICSGALLAGEAGLLENRDCTTHHALCAQLARDRPLARVRENRIFVRDGNVLTSAGVTAGIDLTLFVLAELEGESLALTVSRELVMYLRRSGEDPQLSPLLAHRNHLHPLVHRVQDAIIADHRQDWSLPGMARLAHMSTRQLTRVFHACTGMTPAAYVTLIRVARARELLDTSRLSIERVSEDSGFGSVRQFRRAFLAHFEIAPSRWRATTGGAAPPRPGGPARGRPGGGLHEGGVEGGHRPRLRDDSLRRKTT